MWTRQIYEYFVKLYNSNNPTDGQSFWWQFIYCSEKAVSTQLIATFLNGNLFTTPPWSHWMRLNWKSNHSARSSVWIAYLSHETIFVDFPNHDRIFWLLDNNRSVRLRRFQPRRIWMRVRISLPQLPMSLVRVKCFDQDCLCCKSGFVNRTAQLIQTSNLSQIDWRLCYLYNFIFTHRFSFSLVSFVCYCCWHCRHASP